MTSYEKELISQLEQHYPRLSTTRLLEKLMDMGVIDFSRCKILAVRSRVEQLIKQGYKKIDAMWEAASHFACSYEYVRKCMYYYQDVNLCD